jgi:hypothetical protein
MFVRLFSTRGGSAVRAAVRAGVICATAFGLRWSPEQIAAVQLAVEALLQVGAVLTTPDTDA